MPASTVAFRMNGATVTARLPDADLAGRLSGVYATPHGKDTGVRAPDVVVNRSGEEFVLRTVAGSERFTSVADLAPAFEWALTLAFLERLGTLLHLHAAGAVSNGRAVLALGPTGAGKSTIALHWSKLGAPMLGDDTVLMDETGRAHPFRRLFKLDPAAVRRTDLPLERTPWWTPGSAEAWYDPSSGGGWAGSAPVALVALLERGRDAAVHITDCPRAEGCAALLRCCQATGRTGAAAIDAVVRAASGASFVVARCGDTPVVARRLLEALA